MASGEATSSAAETVNFGAPRAIPVTTAATFEPCLVAVESEFGAARRRQSADRQVRRLGEAVDRDLAIGVAPAGDLHGETGAAHSESVEPTMRDIGVGIHGAVRRHIDIHRGVEGGERRLEAHGERAGDSAVGAQPRDRNVSLNTDRSRKSTKSPV